MKCSEFNYKWKEFLSEGHYGADIDNEEVLVFLNGIFEDLTKIPNFKYFQVKEKFNFARFYSTIGRELERVIEKEINELIKN